MKQIDAASREVKRRRIVLRLLDQQPTNLALEARRDRIVQRNAVAVFEQLSTFIGADRDQQLKIVMRAFVENCGSDTSEEAIRALVVFQ